MKTRDLALATALMLAFSGSAAAQTFDRPEKDRVTIQAFGGGFSPTSDIGGADFDTFGTAGASVAVWLHRFVGVRGNLLYTQSQLDNDGPVPDGTLGSAFAADPDTWLYNGDLIVRYAFAAGANGFLVPYAIGGLGAKTYDFDGLDTETDFAGNFGAGLEYRFGQQGRWGVHAEVRDFVSEFDSFGADDTLHDVVWTGGFNVSF